MATSLWTYGNQMQTDIIGTESANEKGTEQPFKGGTKEGLRGAHIYGIQGLSMRLFRA
jgi:hypothetical protein